ncbi:MAG TPA: TIM barrel protein [Humibacter sp.]|nr:TIM barrel protein [Humibacter sp.]
MTDSGSVRWHLSGFGDEIDADPVVQAAVLQALGANHIEVRSAWDTNVVEMTAEQLNALAAVFADKNLTVSAVASPVGKVDVALPVEHEVERLGRAIAAARILGTRYIRIFSFYHPDREAESVREDVMVRMRALADAAEEADVILLHENEKDIYGDIPSRVLEIIETVDSPALKVAWDAANFVQVGVAPFDDAYALLRPHLEYLQVKDAHFSDASVCPAGEGDGQVQRTVEALSDSGYTGFASLEPHLTGAFGLGGFSGPAAFGVAARAFARVTEKAGVQLV